MRKTSGAERICTVCEQIGDIGDSVKGSSSRMKNKVGAQKGAFIKMKQENVYIYQCLYRLCYVPIITIFFNEIIYLHLHCFALFNFYVQFCALMVWQNCGKYLFGMRRYAIHLNPSQHTLNQLVDAVRSVDSFSTLPKFIISD